MVELQRPGRNVDYTSCCAHEQSHMVYQNSKHWRPADIFGQCRVVQTAVIVVAQSCNTFDTASTVSVSHELQRVLDTVHGG